MKHVISLFLSLLVAVLVLFSAIGENTSAEERSESLSVKLAEKGTIKGKVTYAGPLPTQKQIEITKDVKICGKIPHYDEGLLVSKEDKGLANVVVSLSKVQGGVSLESWGTEFELDQNGCMFVPHVSLVPVGIKLKVKNSDGILHNIHTFSEQNRPINKAQPRFLKVLQISFDKPEVIRMACDVHNWMKGYIVAVDHPYYAVTDANGDFELVDVPAGNYTLKYWHEKLGSYEMEVAVQGEGEAKGSFEFNASKAAGGKH